MAFKRKTAAVDSTPVTETARAGNAPAAMPVAVTRLDELIGAYAGQVSTALQESMLLSPDTEYLPEGLVDGLKQAAAKLNFAYSPAETGSFYFVVTKTAAKYLAGPALVEYAGQPAIKWGDEFIPLSAETPLYSGEWRLIVGGEGEQTRLLFDPAGLAMPISVKPDVATAEEAKAFDNRAVTMNTMGDLVPYLRNGVSPQGLYKLEVGETIQIDGCSDLIESRKGGIHYRILDAIYEDERPCRWFGSDQDDFYWGALTYPVMATRTEDGLRVEQEDGQTFLYAIKPPAMKMGDALKAGQSYTVLAGEEQQGKFGPEVLLTVQLGTGSQVVRANKAIEQRYRTLKAQGQADFAFNPATLIVDSINTSKDGKVRVSARLVTQLDLANPLMQKLMAKQREMKVS